MSNKAFTVGTSQKIRVLVESMDDTDADSLKNAAEHLLSTLEDPAAVVLGSCTDKDKVSLVAAFSPGVVSLGVQAGKFIGPIAKFIETINSQIYKGAIKGGPEIADSSKFSTYEFLVFMCLKKTQLGKFQKLFYEFLNVSAL